MPEYRFHTCCDGCRQQERHGVDFCFDCQLFERDWSKPNLHSRETDLEDVRQVVKLRRQDGSNSVQLAAREFLRDPAKRRELLVELCREQVWENTRIWVTHEEAAKVYDKLLREQKLRKGQ